MNPFDVIVRFERFLLVLFGLLLSALITLGFLYANAASAQTVPGSLRLGWVLPTTGCTTGVTPCDNTPLTGAKVLTGIEVYISTSPIADTSTMAPTLTLAAGATTATHTMTVSNGATLYARVKALNVDGKSPFSPQTTKVIALPVVPGAPSSVTIELTISSP